MKRLWLGAIFLAFIGFLAVWAVERDFNAERILAQSKLNGRTFKGKVEEVAALGGQVKAYLLEEHSIPMTVVAFGFGKAGKAYEPKSGVALMTESVLFNGAGKYSRRELRDFMEERGIRLSVSAGQDRLSFELSFVKEFAKDAIDVLNAVLAEPLLAEEDLDLARRQLAVARKSQVENPQYHLKKLIKEKFYGKHPYGAEDIPEEEVLKKVTAEDIRGYLADYMAKDTLSVGIAGDMDKAEAEAFLAHVFAGLKDKSQGTDLPNVEFDFALNEVTDAPHAKQSFLLLAGKGVKRLDEDFYPLYIADYIFGGSGLSSVLNKEVREKEGLTYGIYSYFSNSDGIDLWQIYFSATPDNVAKALQTAKGAYRQFYDNGVSEEQLAQAKKSLLNSFNLRFASLSNIAEMLEQMQVQKLGLDFLQKRQGLVKAVTLEQVNGAIKRRLPKSLDETGGMSVFEVSGKKK